MKQKESITFKDLAKIACKNMPWLFLAISVFLLIFAVKIFYSYVINPKKTGLESAKEEKINEELYQKVIERIDQKQQKIQQETTTDYKDIF